MRKFASSITFIVMVFLASSLVYSENKVQPVGEDTYFVIDNKPVKVQPQGNPLDYACQRIGIDLAKFELPRGVEAHYHFAARFPVIDYVFNDARYMKQWTEDITDNITKSQTKENLLAVQKVVDTCFYPGGIPEEKSDVNFDQFIKTVNKDVFTEKYHKILSDFLKVYLNAERITRGATATLSKDELQFFNDNPAYFLMPDGNNMPGVTADNIETFMDFIKVARKVKFERIFYGQKIFLKALNDYVSATRKFKTEDFIKKNGDQQLESSVMNLGEIKIVISGGADDTHKDNVALLIDIGGNDTYTNNAGANYKSGASIAAVIDHSGNDQYLNPEESFVQGFGFLGTGIIVDLSGDDVYRARHFSQGVGVMGVGIIWDNAGSDKYDAHGFCQGAAMFGVGAILENAGNDDYDCASLGQGAGCCMGVGFVSDFAGNDSYKLLVTAGKSTMGATGGMGPGYGQGGGLSFRGNRWSWTLTPYGGVGILNEVSGNDTYESKAWNCQGGSYVMSLGALVDHAGDDKYTGTCSMGSAIHITSAILIDKSGNDSYGSGFRNGGSGADRSAGLLIDYRGDDKYGVGGPSEMAFGVSCKPDGISLVVDYEGKDTYMRKTDGKSARPGYPREVFGGVWPANTHDEWTYGMLLDLGGEDDYQVANRENDSERISYGHGIHLDTTWKGGDVFGKIKCPLEPYKKYPLPKEIANASCYQDIATLQDPNLFTRFQAVGRIVEKGSEALPALVAVLKNSQHRQVNRDLIECLNYLFVYEKIKPEHVATIAQLLQAKDEEVRYTTSYNFGIWNMTSAEEPLIAVVANDKSDYARTLAAAALLQIHSKKSVEVMKQAALNDKYYRVRMLAASCLGDSLKEKSADILIKMLTEDCHPAVRESAAGALMGFRCSDAEPALKKAMAGQDVFIKRSAAKAMIMSGDKTALKALIESMDYPSIDDYSEGEAEFLSAVTNCDFDPGQRRLRVTWEKWYKENADKLDLNKNLNACLEFNELSRRTKNFEREQKVAELDGYLAKYPDNLRAKKNISAYLIRISYEAIIDKKSKNYAPQKSLEWAQKAFAVEASENNAHMIIDILVEIGKKDEALKYASEILTKNPKWEGIKKVIEDINGKKK